MMIILIYDNYYNEFSFDFLSYAFAYLIIGALPYASFKFHVLICEHLLSRGTLSVRKAWI